MEISIWVGVGIIIVIVATTAINWKTFKSIVAQLSVIANAFGSKSEQLDTMSTSGKSLADQYKNIMLGIDKLNARADDGQYENIMLGIDKLNARADEADRRNAYLSGDLAALSDNLREISNAIEKLAAFKDRLEHEHYENIRLRNDREIL
jgi:chromosome segregation ATPase